VRRLLSATALALLAACQTTPPAPAPAVPGQPADFPDADYRDSAGEVFRISPDESWLRLYVYRGGRLARLGHNHVVSSRRVAGLALLAKQVAASRADVYLPVASLVVDDPALRAAAGADFQTTPSEADIAGTRANMLGADLLDAANHPFILARVRGLDTSAGSASADLELVVRDSVSALQVPLQIEQEPCVLHVSSAFPLQQTALGLTPFSVLGGALRVEDGIDAQLYLVARSLSPACAAVDD